MAETKKALLVGLDPAIVDFGHWPGLTPEKIGATLRAAAPGARICFNSNPADSAEAVRRWL